MDSTVPLRGRVVDDPADLRRSRALGEIGVLAWLLDNSIPVPMTGGRRFGLDAVIGLVPIAGDLATGAIGLFIVWRGSRLGIPRIVVARMLANTAIDLAVGIIPLAGDAFDLWFKANTRNLALMHRYVAEPDASTTREWLAVGTLVGAVVGIIALFGWLIASLIGAVVGLFA